MHTDNQTFKSLTLQPRKSILKHWWSWVIIVVVLGGLFILVMSIITDDEKKSENYENTVQFSSDQLEKANEALNNGITINDGKDDFLTEADLVVEGYQVPPFDAKSISFGIDDRYFYFKCIYWETAPKDLKIKDYTDFQMNCGISLYIDQKQDNVTKWGKGQYHLLATNYDFAEKILMIELYLDIPEGAPEEEYDYKANSHYINWPKGGLVYGGAGYDNVIAAWPLSELGMKIGDAVTININTEVGAKESKTHLAVDMIPQGSKKDDSKIKWILGQNEYLVERSNKH